MGIVVHICYLEAEATYFVQTLNEREAQDRAYEMFRQEFDSWYTMAKTLREEAKDDESCLDIEVLAKVDYIIL